MKVRYLFFGIMLVGVLSILSCGEEPKKKKKESITKKKESITKKKESITWTPGAGKYLVFTNNILKALQPFRDKRGAIHFVGEIKLPHNTKIMLDFRKADEERVLGQMKGWVQNPLYPKTVGLFNTSESYDKKGYVIPGRNGFTNKGVPYPKRKYSIEILCYFSSAWQNTGVLKITQKGQKLKGDNLYKNEWGTIYYKKIVEFEI